MLEEEYPTILGVHDDYQLIAEEVEGEPPQIENCTLEVFENVGAFLRSQSGVYALGEWKNSGVKIGDTYRGYSTVLDPSSNSWVRRTDAPDLHIHAVNNQAMENTILGMKFQKSISIQQHLQLFPQHPNIIRLVACLQDHRFTYAIYENGGEDLFNVVSNRELNLSEIGKKYIFRQILSAFFHLQHHGIYHGDPSLENFLIDKTTLLVKVIDFDLAKRVPRLTMSQIEMEMNQRGLGDVNPYPEMYPFVDKDTLVPLLFPRVYQGKKEFMPPEMLDQQPLNGYLADNWSLGVLLYYLLLCRPPWEYPLEVDEWFLSVQRGNLLNSLRSVPLSNNSKDLLSRVLVSVNPSLRFSLDDLAAHNWMND